LETIIGHLRKTFFAGLFVIIPIGITIFILKFLFNLADGILGSSIDRLFTLVTGHELHIPGLGMIIGAVAVYFAGLITTNFIGSKLLKFGEAVLNRIPIVKSIYTSSKQLIEVFQEGKSSYRRAVFVEWPRPGVKAVGFVTAELVQNDVNMVVVYLPTMPNPTSGFALYFRADEVQDSGMTVEDAVKFVVSGGVVLPPPAQPSGD
jgi:uncharacterized membrane protein